MLEHLGEEIPEETHVRSEVWNQQTANKSESNNQYFEGILYISKIVILVINI